MGSTEVKNMKCSRKNKINHIGHQSQEKDDVDKLDPISTSNQKYEPSDFEVNQEFIEENKKIDSHLVTPKHNFAPFTRAERKVRRDEVYKLHFEHGMPATRIAVLMKVDRNTINNDLKILYNRAARDYNSDKSLDDIIEKQLLRLETQRDRLGIYLCDAKDINSKITIERLITDIDFKVIGVIDRLNQNIVQHHNAVIEQVNKIAEKEKLKTRYTSLFELYRISVDTRQDLDKLREKVWGKQQQENKEQKEEREKK